MSKFRWPWQRREDDEPVVGFVIPETQQTSIGDAVLQAQALAGQIAEQTGEEVDVFTGRIVTVGGRTFLVTDDKWPAFLEWLEWQREASDG